MKDKNRKNLNDVQGADHYDVKSARSKIKNYLSSSRYRRGAGQTSNTSFEQNNQHNIELQNSIEDYSPYTSSNELSAENISRLDSRLTNYETYNTQAHDNLRKELETKIDNAKKDNTKELEKVEERCHAYVDEKTKENTFFPFLKWLIGIVITLILTWFSYSYVMTTNKVSENEKSIIKIQGKVDMLLKQVGDSAN